MDDRFQRLLQGLEESCISAPNGALSTGSGREPAFRLNRADVSFLKSIGIDATRRAPRRKDAPLD